MSNLAYQDKFISDTGFQDQYIEKVEVLNKVKLATLLPDNEHMTAKMVAEYFEVDYNSTIKPLIFRKRSILEQDGLRTLKGAGLKEFKAKLQGATLSATAHLTIIPRRAILRIGMMLQDSEVAEHLRTYLLNIEEKSTKEQRSQSLDHLGTWTPKEELILLDCFYSTINNGGSLNEAAQKASEKINHTKAACLLRYTKKLKNIITDESFFETVKSNKRNKRRKNNKIVSIVDEVAENTTTNKVDMEKLDQIHNSQTVMVDIMFTQNNNLMNDVFRLTEENKQLILKVKEQESEIAIKDILMTDKDRQIVIINENNIALLEENKTLKKNFATFKTRVANAQYALSGKTPEKKRQQHEKENSRTGMNYKIKDGVPVFES
ncbi:hypothetical protein [Paenibacillus elgii]|uniref:hypothetical protein n=1 Tax=Paenibacillus elgii TaxID=189691 RepID=UPI000248D643|nr:hypothetical protein [Paenibacillus elgii]